MNDIVLYRQPAVADAQPVALELPHDLEVAEANLRKAREQVADHRRKADGLIVGLVGLDGLLGLIPIIGLLYTLYGGFFLFGKAMQVKASIGTKIFGIFIIGLDGLIGIFVGVGDIVDIFLRSHAIFGGRIIDEIDTKLAAIDAIKRRGERRGHLSETEITDLRNIVFRGGRSEIASVIRTGLWGGVLLIILYGIFIG